MEVFQLELLQKGVRLQSMLSGAQIKSIFEGIAPSTKGSPDLNSGYSASPAVKLCVKRNQNRLASLASDFLSGSAPPPCPPPTVCSGSCVCSIPTGEHCCAEAWDFRYDCDECQDEGEQDVYFDCGDSCCWSASVCRAE